MNRSASSDGPFGSSRGTSTGFMAPPEEYAQEGGASLAVLSVTIVDVVKAITLGRERGTIANMDVNRVTIVGQVRECRLNNRFVTFILDDKTGCTVEAKFWGDSLAELAAATVGIGKYVRVYGRIQSQGENVGVTVHSVRPVSDTNEVFFHMVDVIHTHVILERSAHEQEHTEGPDQ